VHGRRTRRIVAGAIASAAAAAALTQATALAQAPSLDEPNADAAPPMVASLRVTHSLQRLDRGLVRLTLSCRGDAGRVCRGSVLLRPADRSDVIGLALARPGTLRYSVPVGASRTIRLRPPVATRDRLRRSRTAVAVVVTRTLSADGVEVESVRAIKIRR
jgi:hypothetical protein